MFHASWGQLGVSSFRIADLRHAELAAEIIATLEWDAVGTMNHAALGMLAYHLGDLDTWMEASTKSWHEARARGDVIQSGGAAFLVGIGAQRLCDPRVAIEWLGPELDAWPAPAAAAPWGIAPRLVSALADAGDLPAMRALVREHTARDEERIEVLGRALRLRVFRRNLGRSSLGRSGSGQSRRCLSRRPLLESESWPLACAGLLGSWRTGARSRVRRR